MAVQTVNSSTRPIAETVANYAEQVLKSVATLTVKTDFVLVSPDGASDIEHAQPIGPFRPASCADLYDTLIGILVSRPYTDAGKFVSVWDGRHAIAEESSQSPHSWSGAAHRLERLEK